jgi:GTP:adenosylcobinamide-phosphate guanylyltransferase
VTEAVVMAAGEGRRLRPLTERYAKPVLPIDGRPVIVTLLQDLRASGVGRITIVVGHLADQVERLLLGFPHELRFARQPEALGAADAVLRAELEPPYFVLGADTRFAPGAVAAFVEQAPAHENALAVRARAGAPRKDRVRVENGLLSAFDHDDPADPTTGAPLWLVGPSAHAHLAGVPGPPFEIKDAFQRALDEGVPIGAVEVGPTRDLTRPEDVICENFGYLRAL